MKNLSYFNEAYSIGIERKEISPLMHTVFSHLDSESQKPYFQRFLERPKIKQACADIKKDLDFLDLCQKSRQDANKK